MSFKVFHDSCRALGKRLVADGGGEFEFEKDDEDMMDLIAAATNLRSFIFGILPIQTRFQTKEMAGNIIPAIATTNAVISGFMSLIANRLIANLLSYPPAKLSEGVRSAYLINGNPNRQILSEALQPPNAQCSVCSQLEYRQVEVNCDSVTLGTLLQFVARDGLEMGGDVQIIRSSDG
jgi:ubiquitin-like 1-activating enzyme E1 B